MRDLFDQIYVYKFVVVLMDKNKIQWSITIQIYTNVHYNKTVFIWK